MGERGTDDTHDSHSMSVLGDSLPGVTADHTRIAPQAACCEDHDADGEAERCCDECPDALPVRMVDTAPGGGEVVVIDMWEINQRNLELMVASGTPLPEGITAGQVAAWRAERGPGESVTHTPGADLAVVDIAEVVDADPDGAGDRCPAACGLPADQDSGLRSRARCRVHPDGAHRCYRRPAHQTDQGRETEGRLSKLDHECDCGYVWLSLTGGEVGLDRLLARQGQRGALKAVLASFARVPHQPGNRIFSEMVRSVARDLGVRL